MGFQTDFIFNVSANISDMQKSIGDLEKSLSRLSLPKSMEKEFATLISRFKQEAQTFSAKSSKPVTNKADFSQIETSGKKALETFRKIEMAAKSLSGLSSKDKMRLFPPDMLAQISAIEKGVKKYNSAVAKNESTLEKARKKVADYERAIESLKQEQDALGKKGHISASEWDVKSKELKRYRKELAEVSAEETATKASAKTTGSGQVDKRTKEYKALMDIEARRLAIEKQIAIVEKSMDGKITASDRAAKEQKLNSELDRTQREMQEQLQLISKLESSGDSSALEGVVADLKEIEGLDLSNIQKIEDLLALLTNLKGQNLDKVNTDLDEMDVHLDNASREAKELEGNIRKDADAVSDLNSRAGQIQSLQQTITQFFSLTNSVQLFRRAVTSAFDTVKELDAAMSETAVVTDFSIGDMWDKLPEYSDMANEFGVSIKGAYEATTLFYQQGLKTKEAMDLANETLKMSRIAGVEAAEATDMMTAALRGFNMELDKASAERVNDVYANLAAVTAADTEEIATAMTKTASIANSANMEFETTAALLSQIIETTREAPETAGTAMKTIIARFTEVKKLSSEGLLSGKDGEGEDIEINKIDAALRTVGISLKDFLNGSKGIDDIFLELAAKWDDLDLSTQRYIATTAAGSRQQSRFIAMMSDYSRTMELVDAANNSAGTSTEQMSKLAESLESKMNNLKNAWDTFLMGLANNEVIKAAVDILTGILTVINQITEVIKKMPGLGGIFATLFQVVLVAAAMKGLKKLLTFGTNMIASMWTDSKNAAAATAGGKRDGKLYAQAAQSEVNKVRGVGNNGTSVDLGGNNGSNGVDANDIDDGRNILKSIKKNGGWKASGKKIGTNMKGNIQHIKKGTQFGKTFGGMGKTGIKGKIGSFTGGLRGKFGAIGDVAKAGGVSTAALAASSIAGAITGAVKGYQWMEDVISKGTLANKLKEAQKATASAAATAKKAEENYKNLFSQKSNYESAIDNLEKLDKGTMEWRQSLLESNNAVLELLDTYPELTKYVSKGKDGQLVISDEGWAAAEDAKRQQMANSSAMLAGAKSQEAKLREDKAREDYEKTLAGDWSETTKSNVRKGGAVVGGVVGGATGVIGGMAAGAAVGAAVGTVVPILGNAVGAIVGGLVGLAGGFIGAAVGTAAGEGINMLQDGLNKNEKDLNEELLKRAEEGTLHNMTDKEKQELVNTYGVEKDRLEKAIEKLEEFSEATEQATLEQQMYTQQMIMSGLSTKAANSEYADEVAAGVAKYSAKNMIEQTEARSDEIFHTGSDTSDDDWREAKLTELGLETGGSEKEQLQKIYAAQSGKTLEEVQNDETLDEETLASAIASVDLGEDIQAGAEEIIEAIDDMSKQDAKNISGLLSDSGAEMTRDMLNQLKGGAASDGEILAALTSKGIKKDDLKKAFGITLGDDTDDELYEALRSQLNDSVEAYNDTITSLDDRVSSIGTSLSDEAYTAYDEFSKLTNNQVTNAQMSDIYELIDNISTMGGDANATWDLLMGNILQDAQAFGVEAEALEMITATDFSSVDSIETLKESLKTLGLDIDDNIVKQIADASNAVKTFNMTKVKEEISSLIKTADELSESDEKKITEETYKLLIDTNTADKSDFIARGDEYYYLGDSMQELVDAIEKNTSAILQEEKKDISERYTMAKRFHDFYESGEFKFKTPNGGTDDLATAHQKIMADTYGGHELSVLKSSGGLLNHLFPELKEEWQFLEGDELVRYYKEKIVPNYIQNFSQLEEQYKIYEDQIAASQYTQIRSGQGLLDEKAETVEEKQHKTGAFEVLMDDIEGARKNYNDLVNQWKNQSMYLAKNGELLKAHAIDLAKDSQELKDFKDTIKDNFEVLDDRNKGTQEYDDAVNNIFKAIPKQFKGLIDQDFITNNKEWLKAISNYGQGDTFEEIAKNTANGEAAIKAFYQAVVTQYAPKLSGLMMDIYNDLEPGQAKDITQAIEEMTKEGYTQDFITDILEFAGLTITDQADGTTLASLSSSWRSAADYEGAKMNQAEFEDEKAQTKNPFDWLYNLIQDMEVQARQTARLEKEYNRMLESRNATAEEIAYNLGQQLAQSYINTELNNKTIEKRQEEIDNIFAENQDIVAAGGFSYNKETNALYIDYEKINQMIEQAKTEGDLAMVERLEEFESGVKTAMDDINDKEDANDDEKDKTLELVQQMTDKTIAFYNTVFDTVKSYYQSLIDEQAELNNTIDEANDRMISSMRDIVDKERQARENEKREEELASQYNRLAYLRQDTSGANQNAILDLEKQIEQDSEDYTDTLVDQKINELEEQNEQAAEQRQRQIEIAQFQLDEAARNGQLMAHAMEVFQGSVGTDGKVSEDSGFGQMYMKVNELGGKSRLEQLNAFANLNGEYNSAAAFEAILSYTGEEGSEGIYGAKMEEMSTAVKEYLGIDGEEGVAPLLTNNLVGSGDKSLQEYILEHFEQGAKDIAGTGNDPGTTLSDIYGRIPNISDLNSIIWNTNGSKVEALKNELMTYMPDIVGLLREMAKKETGSYEGLLGDINFDGVVDRKDLDNLIVGRAHGDLTPQQMNAADINQDGYVDHNDEVALLDTIVTNEGKEDNLGNTTLEVGSKINPKAGGPQDSISVFNGTTPPGLISNYKNWDDFILNNNESYGFAKDFSGATIDSIHKFTDGSEFYRVLTRLGGYYYVNAKDFKAFKTGGIADYTGPAWLDGTPTKPELVLNAQDTQNFIALKNILAEVMNGSHFNSDSSNEQLDKLIEQSEVAKNQRDTQIALLSGIMSHEEASDSSTEEAVRAVEQRMTEIAISQGIMI